MVIGYETCDGNEALTSGRQHRIPIAQNQCYEERAARMIDIGRKECVRLSLGVELGRKKACNAGHDTELNRDGPEYVFIYLYILSIYTLYMSTRSNSLSTSLRHACI